LTCGALVDFQKRLCLLHKGRAASFSDRGCVVVQTKIDTRHIVEEKRDAAGWVLRASNEANGGQFKANLQRSLAFPNSARPWTGCSSTLGCRSDRSPSPSRVGAVYELTQTPEPQAAAALAAVARHSLSQPGVRREPVAASGGRAGGCAVLQPRPMAYLRLQGRQPSK
jgi:hypothetical protein